MSQKIILTQGKTAIVDDEDFERLGGLKWYVACSRNRWYAARAEQVEGKRRTVFLHSKILSAPKGFEVDHINNDSLDCRRANLRLVTHSQNMANRNAPRTNSSGYKGVHRHSRSPKWQVKIKSGERTCYLGLFSDPIEGAKAYDAKAREIYGECARVNFP